MYLFVVNEKAGNGRGRKVWRSVEAELQSRRVAYRAITEADEEKACAQAAELLRRGEVKAVAAIGGDGTLHSLLPLLAGSGVPLGIIPAGSGNDTARAFRIPKRTQDALAVLLNGQARPSDILSASLGSGERRLTLTALAVGFDAAIVRDVNGSRYKRWCNRLGVGSLAYIIGLLRVLTRYQPRQVTVRVDGQQHIFDNVWLSAISNTSSYGGGLRINPGAEPADGLLHVCVVHDCTPWKLLRLFPTILNGSHVRTRVVTVLRGASVEIVSDRPIEAFGDGEPAGETPITAKCVPNQLLFVTASASG
ncbi:diacylglycerol kinase family protein [Cohnella lubricantis]|uniref:Diacylglycerol kinase family lipid kinase n=1 Tax=Cohnella lubricantis TaxID=2163172 RepID=A0A841THD6_9BACL|nr:diacylglycerol kinase family protein [Cohnella lubricantis]MBB6678658.1 diacylglycerol kinase family lipid kinase [Cohnella lubricantis]MBP2119182.1 YegS/Rv2252/BmrU family lipid kinase [Cohnella lubricantis]